MRARHSSKFQHPRSFLSSWTDGRNSSSSLDHHRWLCFCRLHLDGILIQLCTSKRPVYLDTDLRFHCSLKEVNNVDSLCCPVGQTPNQNFVSRRYLKGLFDSQKTHGRKISHIPVSVCISRQSFQTEQNKYVLPFTAKNVTLKKSIAYAAPP